MNNLLCISMYLTCVHNIDDSLKMLMNTGEITSAVYFISLLPKARMNKFDCITHLFCDKVHIQSKNAYNFHQTDSHRHLIQNTLIASDFLKCYLKIFLRLNH